MLHAVFALLHLGVLVLLAQPLLLQQRVDLRGPVDLGFRLLRLRVERQSRKLHCHRTIRQTDSLVLGRGGGGKLTLLAPQRRAVHRLAHHAQHEVDRAVHRDVVLVLLLQQALSCAVVRTDARRLPARVVSRWVRVVQLELVVWVIAGVEERDAEWAKTWEMAGWSVELRRGRQDVRRRTSILCVPLLEIAQTLHEQFYRDVFVVVEQMSLCCLPCVVH